MRYGLFALMMLALLTADVNAEKGAKAKLKGLLVTGGCCHDYTNQKRIITEGLSQRVNIDWDVVHEGGTARDYKVSVYMKKDWAKEYDVIVHNECFGGIKDSQFISKITEAHFAGVPAIFIHCSLHSYRAAGEGAEPWRELVGVTSRRHEKHRAVDVKTVNAEHPVMTGFPKQWKSPNGELYVIEKVWDNCVPLATAFGQDTKNDHVVAWVNTFGKARVFGTSLGHHNDTMNNEVWLGLVSRGLLWTCGKLTDDGKPMPGFEGSGIKPIKIGQLQPKPDPKFASK